MDKILYQTKQNENKTKQNIIAFEGRHSKHLSVLVVISILSSAKWDNCTNFQDRTCKNGFQGNSRTVL